MAGYKEVLFIADENDPASSVDCYDLQLGTKIGMYGSGSGVVRGSLQILGKEYFMSAEVPSSTQRGVGYINIWSIDTRNQVKRISVPGEVTAMATSDNDIYCVAGVNDKIYVWNIPTGQLLNVLNYHHEPITKILFWNTNYFATSGEDGLVAVWRLVDVITKETGESFGPRSSCYQEPFFCSSKHSLPVTDIFLAPCGSICRLFTVAADQNCHMFSIGPDGGKFLVTLAFDFVLTSVLCDHFQKLLFVGTSCGKVILFLLEPNSGLNMLRVGDENSLEGHTAAVRALSITQEDDLLATGADDRKVIIWGLANRQQLHTCDMHGTVSNLFFYVLKHDFLTPGLLPKTLVSTFERNILCESDNLEIKLSMKNEVVYDDEVSALEEYFIFNTDDRECTLTGDELTGGEDDPSLDLMDVPDSDADTDAVGDEELRDDEYSSDFKRLVKLKRELLKSRLVNRRLKRVNKKLYLFGLEQIWENKTVSESTST